MSAVLTFSALDVRERVGLMLRACVERVGAVGGMRLAWTDTGDADCVFVETGLSHRPSGQVVRVTTDSGATAGGGLCLHYPPRPADIAELALRLLRGAGLAQDDALPNPATEGSWQRALDELGGLLLKSPIPLALCADGDPVLTFDSARRRAWSNAGPFDDAVARVRDPEARTRWSVQPAEASPAGESFALERALWRLGAARGFDGLPSQLSRSAPVRLRGWPSALDPTDRLAQKIAARLRLGESSLAELADVNRAPESDVASVLAAMWLCGNLLPSSRPSAVRRVAAAAVPPAVPVRLLDRLRLALGMGR